MSVQPAWGWEQSGDSGASPQQRWDVHPFGGLVVSVLGSPWGQPCYLLLALAPVRQTAAGGGSGGSGHPVAKCKLVMAAWSVAFSELCL